MAQHNIAHRTVSIDVFGPADTTLVGPNVYCSGNAAGEPAVKAWAREEAERRGIKLGVWEYLRYRDGHGWDGRVYGEPMVSPTTA